MGVAVEHQALKLLPFEFARVKRVAVDNERQQLLIAGAMRLDGHAADHRRTAADPAHSPLVCCRPTACVLPAPATTQA